MFQEKEGDKNLFPFCNKKNSILFLFTLTIFRFWYSFIVTLQFLMIFIAVSTTFLLAFRSHRNIQRFSSKMQISYQTHNGMS